jgi:hypothetical protein
MVVGDPSFRRLKPATGTRTANGGEAGNPAMGLVRRLTLIAMDPNAL